MRIFLIIFLAIVSFSFLFSQEPGNFFVINKKGQVTGANGKEIKVNDFLRHNDRISIGENSFINIYDRNDQKYYIIHGVRSVYLKKLVDNEYENEPVNSVLVKAFEKLANAFNSFASSRSLKEIFRSSSPEENLVVISPKNCKVFCDTVAFRWHFSSNDNLIKFILLDENLNPVFDTVVYSKQIKLPKSILQQGKEYVWQISNSSEKRLLNYFMVATQEEYNNYSVQLDSLKNIVSTEDNSNLKILSALIAEEYGFNTEAFEFYKEAIVSSGNKKEYCNMFNSFLKRQKIDLKYTDIVNIADKYDD